ncbi:MAG: hypothetical protein ACFFDR_00990 [Candidatus Thorarchaeota archaeon]
MILSGAIKAIENMELLKDYTTEDLLKEISKANLLIFHGAEDINVNYAS